MPQWYNPLFALLAAQPPAVSTLTLTINELAALAAGPLPSSVYSRAYWHLRSPKAMGQRLRAAGWWVAAVQHRRAEPTITFIRYELTPWASGRWRNGAQ